MGLKEELRPIIGNRRKFMLLRIANVDTSTARGLCHIKLGTYNSWLGDPVFVAIYRRKDELSAEYKQEAIRMLRRENQLAAVLLEGRIIQRLKDEIDTGEFELMKTPLAKAVYDKLISELDVNPSVHVLTWQERLGQLGSGEVPRIEGGKSIEGEYTETTDKQEEEPPEGELLQEGQ